MNTRPETSSSDRCRAEEAMLSSPVRALPHQPGVNPYAVDVTGIVPEGIRIDPYITEGHPGYEESGDSEIIPLEQLVRGRSPEAPAAHEPSAS
jgi:hypothetical protein